MTNTINEITQKNETSQSDELKVFISLMCGIAKRDTTRFWRGLIPAGRLDMK